MINKKSLEAVKGASFSKQFCRPLYSSYCFSQIPATVETLLSGGNLGLPADALVEGEYDHVVFLFLDGFGWQFFEKYKSKLPVLKRLEEEGVISKITSMFPSTTAAHVTCINTGLVPNQSGIYEWFMYEPKLDDIIAPLPFTYAGRAKEGALPIDPKDLYPQKTFHQRLGDCGVQSSVFQPAGIVDSVYSNAMFAGAKVTGYQDTGEALKLLADGLKGKTYSYFYYPDIDSVGHRKGVYSEEFFEAIEKIFLDIEVFLDRLPKKTALLITADHGMVEVSPKDTYYLNKKVPNIEKHLLFGKRGKPLTPAGSCRDFFLHVNRDSVGELKEVLEHFLEGRAEVYLTKELLEEGFFGAQHATQNFLSRVGNLVILPYKGEGIWWYERNRFQQNFYAAHGGLTREEMEIPFFFWANP